MKTIEVYEVGEKVLIPAVVTAIIPDKDRFTYEITVSGDTGKLKHRFQHKDITPIQDAETDPEPTEEEECVNVTEKPISE
jgi:hypothetical protein